MTSLTPCHTTLLTLCLLLAVTSPAFPATPKPVPTKVGKDSPPIYFEYNWGLTKPDSVKEMNYLVHSVNAG